MSLADPPGAKHATEIDGVNEAGEGDNGEQQEK